MGLGVPAWLPPRSNSLTHADADARPTVSPNPLDLGTLAPGASARATIVLRNPGETTLLVDRVEAGCGCMRVRKERLRVEPGGSAQLEVEYVPDEDPNFRADLSVALTGFGLKNAILFQCDVSVSVQDRGVELTEGSLEDVDD